MTINLKKRVFTSAILLLALCIAFISQFMLGYLLLIASVFCVLEFTKMISISFKKKTFTKYIINTLFLTYIFLFFSALFILTSFVNLKILIFIFLLTCICSDIGGYIFGKFFKGPKLSKISPNKTISGSIGSILLATIFFSFSIYYSADIISFYVILIGIVTSISSQIGDLFFSYVKRKSFLEDTGNFLPGHGGVLDRIDGMLLGIPVGLVCLSLLH